MSEETSSASEEGQRRREKRETVSEGTADLDGVVCPLIDWSASGFLAGGYEGALAVGDRPPLRFSVTLEGETFYFDCKALIVRIDPEKRHVAAVFVEMDVEDRLAISQYFE